jgi:hypothetical protein
VRHAYWLGVALALAGCAAQHVAVLPALEAPIGRAAPTHGSGADARGSLARVAHSADDHPSSSHRSD